MTKKVVVLSEPVPKRRLGVDVCAVVAHALCKDDASLLAHTLQVPLRDANKVFCTGESDRAIRFSPTKRAVGTQKAVFLPLREDLIRGLVSPCARGTHPALYTALILALVHQASEVHWHLEFEGQNPPAQSVAFQDACRTRGVSVVVE